MNIGTVAKNVGHAFAIAWQDLKKGAAAAQAFISSHKEGIDNAVHIAGAVAIGMNPAMAPIVTTFDKIEEALIGEVTQALDAITTAPEMGTFFTVNLPAEMYPALRQIAATLANHPTVVATVAAKTEAK